MNTGQFTNLHISQWLNGLTTVPTLHCLIQHGLLEILGNPRVAKGTEIAEIASKINLPNPDQKLGSLCGAMRTLALQGWISMEGRDEKTAVRLTDAGWIVAEAASDQQHSFALAVASIQNSKNYHFYFRENTNKWHKALEEYLALISLSKQNWGIDEPSGAITHRVLKHFRTHLDGLLICPTMIALGMPVFQAHKNMVWQSEPPIFDLFDKATHSLVFKDLSNTFHRDFISAAFDLLAVQGLVRRMTEDDGVVLTEQGLALVREAANFGVVVSYLQSYEILEDILFGNTYPLEILEDQHVNRIMNVWGSGGSTVIQTFRSEVCQKVLEPIFNRLPLHEQPVGIADMGCGSGVPLKVMANYVINHTTRGRCLHEYPLLVLGADYSREARDKTRETLQTFSNIEGVLAEVIPADVSNPEEFDASIRSLGLKVQDPVLNCRRDVEAKDFLHTQMFLLHDRELSIHSPESALSVIRNCVESVNRWALYDALEKTADIGEQYLPEDTQELVKLIAAQFTTCCSDKGALIPAKVTAADLIQLIRRWLPYIPHGLVLLEPHIPRVDEMREDVPESPGAAMRIEVDPSPGVWGVHYTSGQFLMPHCEHELALTLAGLSPLVSRSTGTTSISLGFWVCSEAVYYNPITIRNHSFNFAA